MCVRVCVCVCVRVCVQRVNTKNGVVSDTPVGLMDVYQEFNELSERFKIMKFKSKVCRPSNVFHVTCIVGNSV